MIAGDIYVRGYTYTQEGKRGAGISRIPSPRIFVADTIILYLKAVLHHHTYH